jgi:hypothetical protein
MFLGQPQIQKKKKDPPGNKEKKKAPSNKRGPRFTAQKLGTPRSTGTLQSFNFSLTTEAVRPEGDPPQQLPEEGGVEAELELERTGEQEEETALQTDDQSRSSPEQPVADWRNEVNSQARYSNKTKKQRCQVTGLLKEQMAIVNSKEYNTQAQKNVWSGHLWSRPKTIMHRHCKDLKKWWKEFVKRPVFNWYPVDTMIVNWKPKCGRCGCSSNMVKNGVNRPAFGMRLSQQHCVVEVTSIFNSDAQAHFPVSVRGKHCKCGRNEHGKLCDVCDFINLEA